MNIRMIAITLIAVVVGGIAWKLGAAPWKSRYQTVLQRNEQLMQAAREVREEYENDREALEKLVDQKESEIHEINTRLSARADAAERNYARILQDIATDNRSRERGPAGDPDGGAPKLECAGGDAAIAGAARRIAQRAVHDAQFLAQCNDTLRTERYILK